VALLLPARIVPPVGVETEFACIRVAYVGADDETKEGVEGRVAMHSLANSRNQIDAESVTGVEKDELPPVHTPLLSTNPATGENHSTSPPMLPASWICRATRERR
jgi:hypothetical protein